MCGDKTQGRGTMLFVYQNLLNDPHFLYIMGWILFYPTSHKNVFDLTHVTTTHGAKSFEEKT